MFANIKSKQVLSRDNTCLRNISFERRLAREDKHGDAVKRVTCLLVRQTVCELTFRIIFFRSIYSCLLRGVLFGQTNV